VLPDDQPESRLAWRSSSITWSGNPDDVEVDDLVLRSLDDVNDAGEERLLGVAGDDDGAGHHAFGFIGLLEQRPHEAGLVDLLHIRGDGCCSGQRELLP